MEGFSGAPAASSSGGPETSDTLPITYVPAEKAEEEEVQDEARLMAELDKIRATMTTMPGATTDNCRTTVLGGKTFSERREFPLMLSWPLPGTSLGRTLLNAGWVSTIKKAA